MIETPSTVSDDERPGPVARLALTLTSWTERWIPDAFIFALIATILVFGAALLWTPSTPTQVIDAWGNGFWDLIPFTLQMSLIIITGHVLATSAPMGRAIRAIASWPQTPRGLAPRRPLPTKYNRAQARHGRRGGGAASPPSP